MPASLSHKFQSLEAQITRLKVQQQLLIQERTKDITRFVVDLNLALLDDMILTGLFLFVHTKMESNDPILETWREMGKQFRHNARKAKCTIKLRTSKAASSHAPPQPSHPLAQSGENKDG